jgi:hypothetical protein
MRGWNYIMHGYSHGEIWRRQVCTALKLAGYDVLSIKHEDMRMSPMEACESRSSFCAGRL